MSEDQIRLLEDRTRILEATVGAMRENAAAQRTLVDLIHTDMRSIKTSVDSLTAAMNKGKGGLAAIVTISTTAGGFLTWLATNLFGKH